MVKQSQSVGIVVLVEVVLEETVVLWETTVMVIEVQGINCAGCQWKRYPVALKKKIQSVAVMNLMKDLYKCIQKKFLLQYMEETISLRDRNCKDSIRILGWVVLVGVFKAIKVQLGDRAHLAKVREDPVSSLSFRWLHRQLEWPAWEVQTNQV